MNHSRVVNDSITFYFLAYRFLKKMIRFSYLTRVKLSPFQKIIFIPERTIGIVSRVVDVIGFYFSKEHRKSEI